jgi:hypothetical protein
LSRPRAPPYAPRDPVIRDPMIVVERWKDAPRSRPVHLFGAGRGGRLLKEALERRGVQVAGVIDNMARGALDGAPIRSPATFIAEIGRDATVLIASHAVDDIARQLREFGVHDVRNAYPLVMALLEPPVRLIDLARLATTLLRTAGRVGLAMWRAARRRAPGDRPLRVVHCPTSVGGHPQGLAGAERRLGLASRSLLLEQNYLNYAGDEVLWRPEDAPVDREISRLRRFVDLLEEADVVHFNFGSTLLCRPDVFRRPTAAADWRRALWNRLTALYQNPDRLLDARILRRLGKTVVVTYQGDDARQGDFCRRHFAVTFADETPPAYYRPESDAQKRRSIQRFAEIAQRIYALNPDLLHVLPPTARFTPYAHLDIAALQPKTDWSPDRPPVVAHAPTNRLVKGTRFIEAALDEARRRGARFEFMLIEKMDNAAALQAYARADLFIDQVLCGWYGGVAVEAMALGIPVVCYLRDEDMGFLPPEMAQELPIIRATPDTLAETLHQTLCWDRRRLQELGVRSRRFVERWHDPLQVAAALVADYRAAADEDARTPRSRLIRAKTAPTASSE